MATEALKSTQITNRDASPQVLNDPGTVGAFARKLLAKIESTTGKTVGSTYRMFQIPSNAIISSLKLWCDALSTSVILDIGVYRTTGDGGAVVSANLFANDVDCSSAVAGTEQRYNALNIDTVGKQLWDLLGLSADPSVAYDIVITTGATMTAGGTIVLDCAYQQ
jgi:hypothetical protein